MKQFLIHTFLFIVICLLSIYAVFNLANGQTDEYYLKLTTPTQSSLVIGSSRAAQGIQPRVINSSLPEVTIYNYAFSRVHTPYGDAYFKNIKKKLAPNTKNGLFILEVNPWTISSQTADPEDYQNFKELNSFTELVSCVTCKPNIMYLLHSYGHSYYKILRNTYNPASVKKFTVRSDGWFEVQLKEDVKGIQMITQSTMDRYKSKINIYSGPSLRRLGSLEDTIAWLQEHGRVILVRLPTVETMELIEQELMPDFDLKINTLADKYQIDYLNLMPLKAAYTYTDGHHLDKQSGAEVTKVILEQARLIPIKQ